MNVIGTYKLFYLNLRLDKCCRFAAFIIMIIIIHYFIYFRCEENSNQNYRVQIFVNELETELCPKNGCSYNEFQKKFAQYKDANLEFCNNYKENL